MRENFTAFRKGFFRSFGLIVGAGAAVALFLFLARYF